VTALTPFQIKQLTARRDALLPEWDLLTEKVKRLRMALIIEPGAAEKFKLEQQILAEDEKLTKLAAELEEIEQKLSQTPTISPPSNNSDPSDRIQQNVKGDGNQIIGQVTGGNVFNIAGDFNILPQNSIDRTTLQVDWLDRSRQLLEAQKHLTTNRLLNKSNRNLDDIHVPLGLIERKERPKVKEEPSPEQGSQLYQTEYTETKRYEHEAFLADVVGKPAGGKHIAIIGEPGAGKTTILTKIGAWLIGQAEQQPPAPLVVAWISLADVGDRRLQEYIRAEWLQKVCEDNFDAAWEDWKGLRQQGRVWLLLDGLDEMSGDALAAIHRDLGQAWAQNLRVVITCRLNQWETAAGGNILTNSFDVYRTLDYSYQTSQGDDQVKKFISKWFADNEKVATQIRTELDAPGKERIKDLVKNPLRLTLLCASWEKDNQALPETQADLYRGFVNYLYKWKAAEFSDEVKLRQELDLALGKLAKAGLNRVPINDGAVRRFRFTTSEISELWADLPDTLLPAAKNLGWLNVVGEEATEAVYAFYHPTFQEYFAACSIDDWDYFLPRGHIDRPVNCQGEDNPIYRVFEQEWRQPILLWLGREDITSELKENFIDKLMNFREQEGEFYYYRAYCMAAICVGEFKFSQQAKVIVEQIVTWAFCDLSIEGDGWETLPNEIKSLSQETIFLTHRIYAIDVLASRLLTSADCYGFLHDKVINILGRIGVGNETAIAALIRFLEHEDLKYSLYPDSAVDTLGEISIGSKIVVSALIKSLKQDDLSDWFNSKKADALKKVGIGDREVISALIELLEQNNLSDFLCHNVADLLGTIDIGNKKAISALLKLLECDDCLNHLRYYVANSLGTIDVSNKHAVSALLKLLECNNLDNWLCHKIAHSLGTIDIGNQQAIGALLGLLEHSYSDYEVCNKISSTLETIATGNQYAIAALAEILNRDNLPDILCGHVINILGKIDTNNQCAISKLVELLVSEQNVLDYNFHLDAIDTLREIGVGNQQAIDSFVQWLNRDEISDWLRFHLIYFLAIIDEGNQYAIAASLEYLKRDDLHYLIQRDYAWVLGMLDIGNQQAVETLVKISTQNDLSNSDNVYILDTLGQVDSGNQYAIDTLVQILIQSDLDYPHYSEVTSTLTKIITKQTMPSVTTQLKYYVTNKVYSSNFKQLSFCHKILFHCAQTLSYPEFHTAWHQIDPNHLAHQHR
jgi:energy-coupling factor transporter ATP-binding protein EcfA2